MATVKKSHEMDMCSGSIVKKMLLFAIPLMFSSILQLLFNAVDIIVVGKYAGDNSLAAVGSNTSLINLLTNLFVGMSIGSNVLVARYYGAKQRRELTETVHTAMTLSVISGVMLTIIGVIGAPMILRWMNTPEGVMDLAVLYLRIYFLGMTATMVYNFGSSILRAIGDTKRPLYYLFIAGVVNVILNLLFVIQFHMDVAGVAIATVIAQTISATMIVVCLMKEESGIKLVLSNLKITKDKLVKILQIGLPAGFQGVVFSLSNVVIQSSINSFGEIVVAGNSAAANIEGFVYMAMNAFHQAAISFTSQNVGAAKYERINKILLTALGLVTITGLLFGNLCVVFGEPLLGFYSNNPAVIEAGMVRLRYICIVYFLCGTMDAIVGSIRGLGYAVMPMIVSLLGACALRLVWLATVFQVPEFHTVEVIYISYPVTWILTFATHVVCYVIVRRRLAKRWGR